jgi:hypothetical protein
MACGIRRESVRVAYGTSLWVEEKTHIREISGSHGVEDDMTAFWDTEPRCLIEVDRRFKGAYCLHRQVIDGGRSHL